MPRLSRIQDSAAGPLLLILALGCAGPGPLPAPGPPGGAPPAPSAPPGQPGPTAGEERFLDHRVLAPAAGGDGVIASFGGVEVRKHELFDYLERQDPMQGMQLVNALLAERLAARVAREEGVRVPAAEIDWWVEREEERLRREMVRRQGEGADREEFIALRFGKSPAEYGRWRRRSIARQLVKWFAMVYLAMKEESCLCRVISVAEKEQARKLRVEAEGGADFRILARKYSLHPSAPAGGRMVPLTRNSGHPLAERLFAMAEGEICGPLPGRLGERPVWSILRLDKRLPGDPRPFPELAAQVAHRVRQAPPSVAQVLAFFCASRERFGLRLFPTD